VRRILAQQFAEVANRVHFEFDKSDIRPEDRGILDTKAAILSANSGLRLRISGHADERGSDEYNLALGNRRGAAVKTYLVNKGIDAGRLEVVSYGEERPLAPGHDEASWAENRRAEFEVTAGGSNLRQP
jgi:peptidoglycan-associated lipoprotein